MLCASSGTPQASHADPRTTIRYDRARGSLDRHATYIVAAYVAGAAR
jgi:integrase/recombinase XerD